jgi:Flp pilus assembly protein TadB
MYKKIYPPVKYVFYPLYRHLRKGLGISCVLAYFLVFLVSAILHAVFSLLFGHPIAAILFFLLYIALGLSGVRRIRVKKRRQLSAAQSGSKS